MTSPATRRWIPPWLNDTERAHLEALDASLSALDAGAAEGQPSDEAGHASVLAAIAARFAGRRVLGPFEAGTTTASRLGALRVGEGQDLTILTDDLQGWVAERAAARGWSQALKAADPRAAEAILRALHTELVAARLVRTETECRDFRVAVLPARPTGPADFVQVEFNLSATRITGPVCDSR